MKRLVKKLAASLTGAVMAVSANAQNLPDMETPNLAAIGFGTGPSYVGSNNYKYLPAPLMRLKFGGQRFLSVEGNLARVNILDNPNWRVGPIGILRFGRSHKTGDEVINKLDKIKATVELGGFVGYDLPAGSDPRSRWNFGGHMMHDVGGVHKGFVVAGHVMRWMPVGQYGVFGLNLGTTYGSGHYMSEYFSISPSDQRDANYRIGTFNANSGFRDVRAIAMYIQPINRHWAIGAGGMYQRLVGDAGKSPVTKDRGSKNQWIGGIGIGRFW